MSLSDARIDLMYAVVSLRELQGKPHTETIVPQLQERIRQCNEALDAEIIEMLLTNDEFIKRLRERLT